MIDKKSLKKGDVLTWKNPIKGYMAFGRVKEDGSDVCDVIIGDGDSSNGPGDPFWENEPFAEKGTLKIITDPNLKAIINGYCDMLKA